MAIINEQLSTGLPGLDKVFRGLMPGDNIVWQVDSVEEYIQFIEPYCQGAKKTGQNLIYFRFAKHRQLVTEENNVKIYYLDPQAGFESFIAKVHSVIEQTERGAFYLFDCLSVLAEEWYSDQMLGNFFMLTCPYLYDVEAIAYFAILKNFHSFHATVPIAETTQIFVDVYRHKNITYIHPFKVQQRHSKTMYMLHIRQGNDFLPVTESSIIAEVLTSVTWSRVESASSQLGVWNRAFLAAEDLLETMRHGTCLPEQSREIFNRLLRMAISRDERVLRLAQKYLTLSDIVNIRKRMIGSGLIGGKAVGMLLARAILQSAEKKWREKLESHDSFFIGSDVFYTFLVRNGCWWVRQKQRNPETFMEGAERARQQMIRGTFPEYILKQFTDMLDYFGQCPIIVRSSSLLEDNFGNAFAGKYESVFCANQGSRDQRLKDFVSAVRTVYASTMSEKALAYRAQRGMLDRDEQMALLVQRVSGALYGNLFFPQIAGVGFSFNPYVWNREIDPEAGIIRLVFGLGTRAVDRADDDYTRVIALNAPHRRPEANFDEVRQYTQRRVDVLDLEANQLVSKDFIDVVEQSPKVPVELFASRDEQLERRATERKLGKVFPWVLTFDPLLSHKDFIQDMRDMLHILSQAYEYPIDIEFTTNFLTEDTYKINLVQCRPLQVKGGGTISAPPSDIAPEKIILQSSGAVIGHSRECDIDRIIIVLPYVYGQLPVNKRYAVARLIGRITHSKEGKTQPQNIMLLGPGRWGTTTPSLGVPASVAEINSISILGEIVAMRDDLVPDVSLGTHFFSALVEMDILYLALFPHHEGNLLNQEFFLKAPNKLSQILPDDSTWENVVKVIDKEDLSEKIKLYANTLEQKVICYLAH